MVTLTPAQLASIQNNISVGQFNPPPSGFNNSARYAAPNIPPPQDVITKNASGYGFLRFPMDTPKFYMTLHLASYSRTSLNAVGNLSFYNSIKLPLPTSINNNTIADWDRKPLSYSGAMAAQALNYASNGNVGAAIGTGVATGAVAAGGAIATALGGKAAATPSLASGVAGVGGAVVGGAVSSLAETAGSIFGVAANRFLTVVFQGPSYKEMQFSWNLVARTPEESEQIRIIIKTLNNAASPSVKNIGNLLGSTASTIANAVGLGSVIWGYPSIILMEYVPNPKYLMKFKPAIIRNFAVEYSPGGQPAFFHDAAIGSGVVQAPESIKITMNTLELEFWLGNDDRAQDGDFTDSNDAGDVYGGSSGIIYQNGSSVGEGSRNLNTGTLSAPQAGSITALASSTPTDTQTLQALNNINSGAPGL